MDIIALVLTPPDQPGQHFGEASRGADRLLRLLANRNFCARLRRAESAEAVLEIVQAEGEGMTRREWTTCKDPLPMLHFLLGTDHLRIMDVEAFPECKGSDRKLRLFACACYARISSLLPFKHRRWAVFSRCFP